MMHIIVLTVKRGILSDDPFADSPSKLQAGESLTLNEVCIVSTTTVD